MALATRDRMDNHPSLRHRSRLAWQNIKKRRSSHKPFLCLTIEQLFSVPSAVVSNQAVLLGREFRRPDAAHSVARASAIALPPEPPAVPLVLPPSDLVTTLVPAQIDFERRFFECSNNIATPLSRCCARRLNPPSITFSLWQALPYTGVRGPLMGSVGDAYSQLRSGESLLTPRLKMRASFDRHDTFRRKRQARMASVRVSSSSTIRAERQSSLAILSTGRLRAPPTHSAS